MIFCIKVVHIFVLQYASVFDIKVIKVVYYSCNCSEVEHSLLKVLCYYIQVAVVSFVVFVVVAVVRLFSCLFMFMCVSFILYRVFCYCFKYLDGFRFHGSIVILIMR